MHFGLLLAVTAALLGNFANLMKHRGCQKVDPVHLARPLESARRLARSPWFAGGWALAAVAWMVHVAAISMAPISLVQAVLAGGAVGAAVMAQRFFGDEVEPRQWIALLLGGAGLALLVLTVPNFHSSHSGFAPGAILGFEGGLALLAGALVTCHRKGKLSAYADVTLAAVAGLLFALGGIAIKGITGAGHDSVAILAPWVAVIVVCGILAQYTATAALQRGGAIETIGVMGLVANGLQVVGGVLVFGDPLSSHPLGLALQGCAFVMVCASALIIPARREAGAPVALPT
jgi:drug/metabolite transporter (DMT)-like permease